MSAERDESLRGLDGCGCCAGTDARTPLRVHNRPGLDAVAYRVGTHATFLQTSLAALSAAGDAPPDAGPAWRPPLQKLTARAGDFTPALLDAWAVVGDVLTFYSERIANESWLRPATERRSILELARSIGYELNPGVAASTHLAFTLEEVPGAPEQVRIVRGTRAQSIPGPGEKPQSFETDEELLARPAWNALRPRMSRPQRVDEDTAALWLAGVPAPVTPGDALLVKVGSALALRTVVQVEPDAPGARSRVTLDTALALPAPAEPDDWSVFVFRQRAALFGSSAGNWMLMNDELRSRYEGNLPEQEKACEGPGDWRYLPPKLTQWPGFALPDDAMHLDLDAVYPRLLPGSVLVLRDADGAGPLILWAATVTEAAPEKFGLGGRVTRVGLHTPADLSDFGRRTTTVYLQPEPVARAEEPITDPVPDILPDADADPIRQREFELARRVEAMEAERTVIVRGRPARLRLPGHNRMTDLDGGDAGRADPATVFSIRRIWFNDPGAYRDFRLRIRDPHGVETYVEADARHLVVLPALPEDEEVAEVAVVQAWDDTDAAHPVVRFLDPLRHVYDRASAVLLGNVAFATHGESVAERLGSGDGARPFQRFTLKQQPLTHTPDASPDGGASTLEVRVGDLRWTEVPTLFGRGPRDRVFVTRRQDDGATTVQFGDGAEGARLPTGRENVRAAYRKGIGREGNVRVRQIAQLLTRELGVRDVVNPLPATGGMDPQERDDARQNAPVTVLTLDRVVSLRDYEDFARAFAGVAKAEAVWTWDGRRRGVFLTLAGPEGDALPEDGTVMRNLLAALADAGDPYVPVRAASYRPVRFRAKATLRVHPDRLAEDVLRAAHDALALRFGFGARAFGQPVWRGDVIATLQNVAGVESLDLDLLYRHPGPAGTVPELDAEAPEDGMDARTAAPAELLVIHLLPGDLEVAP